MIEPTAESRSVISFGPFSLDAGRRLLLKDGVPFVLGARTLDTLIALVSQPDKAISKRDLMAKVWPDVIVEEGSLRFHIATLRKALGDGKDGARYIATLAGRGYSFVAPISRFSIEDGGTAPSPRTIAYQRPNMPNPLPQMVGRADSVLTLLSQLAAGRFVTVVGAGGIGKTTVAIAAGHELIEAFFGAVHFVDLGALGDPTLVAQSLAAMLGLTVRSDDHAAALVAYLRDKRVLLILDNCEHLIEAVATISARLFNAAPKLHILATSREALRVPGEHVYRLAPLACPPDDPDLSAAAALTFPAAQLFVERATARGAVFDLGDADAALVASICRKLDGVALAIELTAGRVEAYGLQQTATLLGERLSLLWAGQRTAPPRQHTLKATLDWSYGLLIEPERQVLRQLAVFVGDFTLEAALAVVADRGTDPGLVLGAIDHLVAKSMVATRPVGAMMRYRLLDTTRSYALDLEIDAGLGARHANYYRRWLEQCGTKWPTLSNAAERAAHLAGLGNVRAALEWCFSDKGDAQVGIALAAAAAPVFLAMSLLPEGHLWSKKAILALDGETRSGVQEMNLQLALGLSLMFTRGNSEEARAALARSLEIAEAVGDPTSALQLIGRLHLFHHREGDFAIAQEYARRGAAIAANLEDATSKALAHCLLGISLSTSGDLAGARSSLEAALRLGYGRDAERGSILSHGVNFYSFCSDYLARTLWLQGHTEQAVQCAHESVRDAARVDHPVTLAVALTIATTVFFAAEDLDAAEKHADWLIAHGEANLLRPSIAVGHGFKGELAIRQGRANVGIVMLRTCLREMKAKRYGLLTTPFQLALIEGLALTGEADDAFLLVDEAIGHADAKGHLSYMPELLRVKGGLHLLMPQPDAATAEVCFRQSLDWSRRQGARSWELRTSVDLAMLLARNGQLEEARALLQPLLEGSAKYGQTTDFRRAQRLDTTLSQALQS